MNRISVSGEGPDHRAVTVSVVIPCYNYARFLPAAVASVRDQVGVTTDVIIVDDCSSDASIAVAEALIAADPAVQLLRHEVNQGAVQTFNDGLAAATGTYLVRLDADDLLTPGSLARSVRAAEAFPQVGLVYGHPVHFEGDPPTTHRDTVRSWTWWSGLDWLTVRCRSGVNVITSPEVLMRASVVDRVGGQMPLAHTHDMEMWFRMAAVCDVLHINGSDQALHRDHALSLSNELGDPLDSLIERRAAFDTLFDGVAGTLPEAPTMAASARQALAREALDRVCRAYDRNRVEPSYIDRLIAFATETAGDLSSTREWRAVLRRQKLGSVRVSKRPWYLARAITRRVQEEWRHQRWERTGVYENRRQFSRAEEAT